MTATAARHRDTVAANRRSSQNIGLSRGELAKRAADAAGVHPDVADEIIGAFVGELTDALRAGTKVTIRGFGVFEPRRRRAVVRQPPGHPPVPSPAHRTVAFRPSPPLKRLLNQETP